MEMRGNGLSIQTISIQFLEEEGEPLLNGFPVVLGI